MAEQAYVVSIIILTDAQTADLLAFTIEVSAERIVLVSYSAELGCAHVYVVFEYKIYTAAGIAGVYGFRKIYKAFRSADDIGMVCRSVCSGFNSP